MEQVLATGARRVRRGGTSDGRRVVGCIVPCSWPGPTMESTLAKSGRRLHRRASQSYGEGFPKLQARGAPFELELTVSLYGACLSEGCAWRRCCDRRTRGTNADALVPAGRVSWSRAAQQGVNLAFVEGAPEGRHVYGA